MRYSFMSNPIDCFSVIHPRPKEIQWSHISVMWSLKTIFQLTQIFPISLTLSPNALSLFLILLFSGKLCTTNIIHFVWSIISYTLLLVSARWAAVFFPMFDSQYLSSFLTLFVEWDGMGRRFKTCLFPLSRSRRLHWLKITVC